MAEKILLIAPIDFDKPYGKHIRPWNFYKCLRNFSNVSIGLLQYRSLQDFRNIPKVVTNCSKIVLISGINARWALFFAFICRICQKSVVVDLHGSAWFEHACWRQKEKADRYFLLEYLLLKLADLVTVVSKDLRFILVRNFEVNKDKIRAIPNGVETYATDIKPSRNLKGYATSSGGQTIILSAPRFFHSNTLAVGLAYEVIKHLSEFDIYATIFITGGGKIVEQQPKDVVYTGHLSVQEYYNLLESADLAIAPYPVEAVCGGPRNKMLEYWAHRTLVVSTKNGFFGIPEASPGKNFILGGYDPDDFALAVIETLKLPRHESTRIVEDGYRIVKEKYGWKSQTRKLMREILNMSRKKIRR